MYFVTSKRPGYCLFCHSPSERVAVGVTDDQQRVHLLERTGTTWDVRRDLAMSEQSHTAILVRLRRVEEPATFAEFARLAVGG